ncbi:hypothetical protein LPJ59_006649, partial [Coemansia sp. RSA 2399]
DARDPPYPTGSVRQDSGGSSNSALSQDIPDTQLPSFLFPRRKPTVRKKEIPRLPHYSPEASQKEQGAGEIVSRLQKDGEEEASVVGLGIVDSEGNSPGSLLAHSPRSPSNSQDSLAKDGLSGCGSEENIAPHSSLQPQLTSELEQLRKGDGVCAALTEGAHVVHYGFVPIVETPLSGDQTVPVGSRAVQRLEANGQAVYVTSSELIEVASASTDTVDGDMIARRTALALIVRVKRTTGNGILVEVKGSRFESPQWIEYAPDVGRAINGVSAFVDALQAASDSNAARGLSEQVYKQAECLRCSWNGFIDHERTAFDVLPDSRPFVVLPPPPKELQCPQCKREYLREFYADEDVKQEPGNGDEEDVKPIWKRSFVSRRNRPGSAKRKTKAVAASENEQTVRRKLQIAEAREIAQREIERLGAAAAKGSLPFAEATNAIELFLQLS